MTTILKKFGLPIALVAITAGATSALGATLTIIPIPSWLPGTNVNEGRAISPDGQYVVGVSGTHAWSGYFYDVANNLVIEPKPADAPGAVPSTLNGIGYRTDPVSGQTQLILDGMSSGYQANWMTTDGGLTWGAKRRDTGFSANLLPTANSLGAVTGSDKFYQIIRNTAETTLYTNQGSNKWDSVTAPWFTNNINKGVSPDTGKMNGVAATGRAVGYRINAAFGAWKNNYVLDYPPQSALAWYFNGLAGTTEGQAFSIDASGTNIFGQSPVTDGRFGYWGYKAVVTTALDSLQTINELPNFVDTDGTGGSAAVPFGCSADGRYAVGMSYRGQEKAVLWDTIDPNPANWTVTDLTDLATAEGILGNFTRLTRGYSVGKNAAGNPVITGVGAYFDGVGTHTRAFVMIVSPPTVARPIITSVVGAGTASVTVNFTNTIPTTNYVLRYNTNLSTTNWYNISPPLTAVNYSGSITDTTAAGSPRRYYRVLMQ